MHRRTQGGNSILHNSKDIIRTVMLWINVYLYPTPSYTKKNERPSTRINESWPVETGWEVARGNTQTCSMQGFFFWLGVPGAQYYQIVLSLHTLLLVIVRLEAISIC